MLVRGWRGHNAFANALNSNCRIIIWDGEKSDRALLGLALRCGIAGVEILEASSAADMARFVSNGQIDAVIADPMGNVGELSKFATDVRRRYPACLWFIFGSEALLPSTDDCIGHGIDGRFSKTSAGFLGLPHALFDQLRWMRDLTTRFSDDPRVLFPAIFPGATCLLAQDGTLLSVSKEFEELFGRARFELVGRQLSQLWSECDGRPVWEPSLAGDTHSWTFVGGIERHRRGNVPVFASLRSLDQTSDEDRIWAANFTDISGIAAPISGPTRDDDQTNLEQWTFTLSHDLQAPLNSLESHAKWLREAIGSDAGEDVNSTVSEISALASRMQTMLDSVVRFSVLEKGDESRDIVNLDSVLAEAIANLNSAITESGATIERQPLPALAVNRSQMVQVFQNLLSNAIKFCSARVPRIHVSAREEAGYWQIQFQDNGIGIDPSDMERIFRLFQRLHGESEYPGIGAGLAICKRIIEAHGGKITVSSALGRGSCFNVELMALNPRLRNNNEPTTKVMD